MLHFQQTKFTKLDFRIVETAEGPRVAEPLRIQQIRQFVITATSGSFRAAATGTFRSQAAVSSAMRDLERQIGAKLFEKGRRARLTPLAQTLLPIFIHLLVTHDRVLGDARHLAQAERGSISLAVVPVLAEEWLPAFLTTFTRDHPEIHIRATDQRSPQVRAMVAEGAVDIGVAGMMADDPKLTFQPVASDAFGVLCSPNHRLAKRRRALPWSELSEERVIGNDAMELLRGRGLGQSIENPPLVVTSRPGLMACVKAGLGVTVVPLLTRAEKALGLVFIPLTSPQLSRTIGIVTRRGQTPLPTVANMHDMMLESLRVYAKGQGAALITASPRRRGARSSV